MNKELQQLIKLAAVDKDIDAFGTREEQIKAEVNALTEKRKEIATAITCAHDEVKDAHLNKAKNEHLLKDLAAKLKDLEKKMSQIKSEKELKALQIEEDLVREQISYTNEEIERFEKIEGQKQERASALNEEASAIELKITDATARIEGHTDNTGPRKLNERLSLARANSVKSALVNEYNVNESRLTTQGFAWDHPIADNKTKEGRAMNRRVFAAIAGSRTVLVQPGQQAQ